MKTLFFTLRLISVLLLPFGTYTCSEDAFQHIQLMVNSSLTDRSNELILGEIDIPILCENSIRDLYSIHTLRFFRNHMEEMQPGALKNLPSLNTLILTNNPIGVIRSGVFNGLPVRRVKISWTKITTIEKGAFDDMPNLIVVALDHNYLESLPRWFENTPNVKYLSVTFNHIKSIPEAAFVNLKKNTSVEIYLSSNFIADVHPEAFRGITTAKEIWLDDNRITDLDDGLFAGIRVTHLLDLGYNLLRCLSDEFLKNVNANCLHIMGNVYDCHGCIESFLTWREKNVVGNCGSAFECEEVYMRTAPTLEGR